MAEISAVIISIEAIPIDITSPSRWCCQKLRGEFITKDGQPGGGDLKASYWRSLTIRCRFIDSYHSGIVWHNQREI
jgi:hypothetical protein